MGRSSRAVVFAGAGASCAVSSEKYPTTVGFYKLLEEDLREKNRWLAHFEPNLQKLFGPGEPDIEKVLWVAAQYRNWLQSIRDDLHPASWSIPSNLIANLVDPRQTLTVGNFPNLADEASKQISKLIDRLQAKVYDLYAQQPTATELAGSWVPLLQGLAAKFSVVDVFTTNYDLVVESAITEAGVPIHVAGSRHAWEARLDLSPWEGAELKTGGLLTKLHGSVNWERKKSDVYVAAPQYRGDHALHCILYPGFKGQPTDHPFVAFHSYLLRALAAADLVIFIGFAFRDEYINTCIRTALGTSTPVATIDVRKNAWPGEDVLFRPSPLLELEEGFSKAAIDNLFRRIAA